MCQSTKKAMATFTTVEQKEEGMVHIHFFLRSSYFLSFSCICFEYFVAVHSTDYIAAKVCRDKQFSDTTNGNWSFSIPLCSHSQTMSQIKWSLGYMYISSTSAIQLWNQAWKSLYGSFLFFLVSKRIQICVCESVRGIDAEQQHYFSTLFHFFHTHTHIQWRLQFPLELTHSIRVRDLS